MRQLHGKELSYNNIADADAAWECVKTFAEPACVIVKHANPCGVAIAAGTAQAYRRAFKTDPTSAFGGIIAFNREIDLETVEAVWEQFIEVLIAPRITADAAAALARKTNVRVLEVSIENGANLYDSKRIGGGLLVQTPDAMNVQISDMRIVTRKQPSTRQLADLLFSWRVAEIVKSNAIVFFGGGITLGVGGGQMNRLGNARIPAIQAWNS